MNEDCVKEKVLGFFMAFSVAQCLGTIDVAHIDIRQPFQILQIILIENCTSFELSSFVTIKVIFWTLL